MEELTMEDLEVPDLREVWEKGGWVLQIEFFFSISKKKKKDILTRNGPLSDSVRCRSTALCVARLSANVLRLPHSHAGNRRPSVYGNLTA